jgi:hypothetical protein
MKVLARYAAAARAQAIPRMPDERRIATLMAFANQLTATAQDDGRMFSTCWWEICSIVSSMTTSALI